MGKDDKLDIPPINIEFIDVPPIPIVDCNISQEIIRNEETKIKYYKDDDKGINNNLGDESICKLSNKEVHKNEADSTKSSTITKKDVIENIVSSIKEKNKSNKMNWYIIIIIYIITMSFCVLINM